MNKTQRFIILALAACAITGSFLTGCSGDKAEEQKSKDAIAAKVKRDQ